MNHFLKECHKVYHNLVINPEYYQKVHVVLGNEACDLDSAVCSLVYGYILYHEAKQRGARNLEILPLLNIAHDDLPLKTEVNYYLKLHGVALDLLPTRGGRDSLNLSKMNKAGVLNLTLVDHHTLPTHDQDLISSVVEVIDHRPQESGWDWANASTYIKKVGSCATLITKKILETSPHLLTFQLCYLLYGPIIVDTFNFSQEAGRAQQLDKDMAAALDRKIAIDRDKLFQDLVFAKTHVDSLSDMQILRKDMKVIGNIPVCGLPMLVEEFLRRPFIEQSLINFCKSRSNHHVLVLMGVKIYGDNVEKDIGVFSLNPNTLERLCNSLEKFQEPSLNLKLKSTIVRNLRLYKQTNIRMSRKQIGPIILSFSHSIKDTHVPGPNTHKYNSGIKTS